jgi:2-polyprenyl-3-methyl-5-hydroxy-6-metoxy-1,4-benzoquinol methylase
VTHPAVDAVTCVACGTDVDRHRHHALTKEGYELVRCPVCGMLMRASLPTPDDLAAIYAPAYFAQREGEVADGYADYVADAEFHRRSARRRLELLARFASPPGPLLDVGAAAGFFVAEARARGWDAEGVDVADAMVHWGQEQLRVPLRHGTLHDISRDRTYGVITMWDYIEHSLDPAGELARCRSLLVPEGHIALSTGDVDSLIARASRSRWHLLTPRHHNFFFGRRTLVRTLERVGFEVIWARHPGASYSLEHVAHKLDRMLRVPLVGAAARLVTPSRLNRVGIPINLRDIVTVVARRPA